MNGKQLGRDERSEVAIVEVNVAERDPVETFQFVNLNLTASLLLRLSTIKSIFDASATSLMQPASVEDISAICAYRSVVPSYEE